MSKLRTIIIIASISLCNLQEIHNDENIANYLAVSSNQDFRNTKDEQTIKTSNGHYHEDIDKSIDPNCNKRKDEDMKALTKQWLPSKLSKHLPENKNAQHFYHNHDLIPTSDMRFIVENDGTNVPRQEISLNKAILPDRRSYDKSPAVVNKEKNEPTSNYQTGTLNRSCVAVTKNKVFEFESISVQDDFPKNGGNLLDILNSMINDREKESIELLTNQLNCTYTINSNLTNMPVYDSFENEALSVLKATGDIQDLNSKLEDKEFNESIGKSVGKESTRRTMNTEDLTDRLMEPARIADLSNMLMLQSPVMLFQNSRVCYACSTTNDPSCWKPDRRTTVKYCNKEHDACLIKKFSLKGTTFITRDCGNTCINSDQSGYEPKFDKCTICHQDLCNKNSAVNVHQLYFLIIISGMLSIKVLY